jgi:hypothetical protein
MSTTVCIAPLTAGYPQGAGHLWAYLNWALSAKELGCRVIWLEDVDGLLASRPASQAEAEVATLERRLEEHGLAGALAVTSFGPGLVTPGLAAGRLDLDTAVDESDLLLDFSYDIPADALARFRRSALVDLDPGLLQLWMSEGDLRIAEHDVYLTIGETVGTPEARFPDAGVSWQHTPPPVFLAAWPVSPAAPDATYTTVTNWWGEWLWVDGSSVNNDKRTAFLPYVDLPRLAEYPLELALTIDEHTAATDVPRFEEGGWKLRDAWEACSTPNRYGDYIRSSRAEFSCAKPSCRLFDNAWVSDRTLCYLASGKPAVVEHTGPSRLLPEAEGLLRFRDLGEAIGAIAEVESDYARHSRSARELAEQHFDGERVVRGVLERCLP